MRSLGSCIFIVLLIGGCTDTRDRGDDGGVVGTCGDGTRGAGEVCDGADLGGQSCGSLGLGGGTLACAPDCTRLDAAGCESACTPDCAGRECGPDPACPISSCGECGGGSSCSAGVCAGGDPNAPRIISLSTNTTRLGEGASLIVTAVVTDPDGIADLIGGTLDAPTGASYGAFTASGEGSYSLALTLSALDAVESIAAPPGGSDRTLRARFFDQGGLEATRDITIRIACEGASEGMCGTRCVDVGADSANCGGCGNACPFPSGATASQCAAGQCAGYYERGDTDTTCSATCTRYGRRCDDAVGFDDEWGDCVGSPGCDLERGAGYTCGESFHPDAFDVTCVCIEPL